MNSYVSDSSVTSTNVPREPKIQRKKTISGLWNSFDFSRFLAWFSSTTKISSIFVSFFKVFFSLVLFVLVLGWVWFKFAIFDKMPDVSQIENADFSQTTEITDKHWEVLYKLFDQNREYVSYDDISQNFINALIATEDQTFWTNSGIAFKWISRAVLGQLWIIDFDGGGSTLTQQLLKNLLFTASDSVYKRKVMELFLAWDLNNFLEDQIKEDFPDLKGNDVQRKVKEKILELYANYIFLWNNTYGVEIASQTYFAKSAKDMNILEWAILAGIPQAPSRYDPYTDRAVLMGKLVITKKDSLDVVEIEENLALSVQEKAIEYIKKSDIEWRRSGDSLLNFVNWLLSFKHIHWWNTYDVTYELWRKDFVLARLYQDQYITDEDFKTAFEQWFTYEFGRKSISIKAPHFVFWVMSRLEEEYWDEYLRTWWLTIQTTLDREIQQMAEQSILENSDHITENQANNSAMVYIDSHSGDVIAYVWSKNYDDNTIDGQVDMVQANRQPGSIIKPILYTQWFRDTPITLDSPIYDIELKIWGNEPENSDGEFWWLTTIKEALAWSRNIPAIKMLLNVWWEAAFKRFLYSLWVRSMNMDIDNHWYALSLWAAEIPMIEMANAYMHLSAQWKPADINPILKITKDDDSILYEKKVTMQDEEVPEWVAYLLWEILSNKENFPSWRRSNFTAPGGLDFATKSGTTNVVKDEEKLPRDGWMATYNGTHVLMHWTWNTDWSSLQKNAYGGRLNAPIWKTFLNKLLDRKEIANSVLEEKDVKSVSISKLTGQLSTNATPLVFIKNSLWYINSLPTEYLAGWYTVYIDSMCWGKVSNLTPPGSKVWAVVVRPTTIMPGKYDQKDVEKRWANWGLSQYWSKSGVRLFLREPTKICNAREAIDKVWDINTQILQPASGQSVTRSFSVSHLTTSPFDITSVSVSLGDVQLKTMTYSGRKEIRDIISVTIPEGITEWDYVLKVSAKDIEWFTSSKTVPITLGIKDTDPPYFVSDKKSIKKWADWSYSVILLFGDVASSVVWWSISYGGSVVHTFNNAAAQFNIPAAGVVTYTVKDSSGNVLLWTIQIGSNAEAVVEPTPTPQEQEPPVEPTPTPQEQEPPVEPPSTPQEQEPPAEPPPTPQEEEPVVEQVPAPIQEEEPAAEPAPAQEPQPQPTTTDDDDWIDEARIEDLMNGLFNE